MVASCPHVGSCPAVPTQQHEAPLEKEATPATTSAASWRLSPDHAAAAVVSLEASATTPAALRQPSSEVAAVAVVSLEERRGPRSFEANRHCRLRESKIEMKIWCGPVSGGAA
jgi:hypothetical protein